MIDDRDRNCDCTDFFRAFNVMIVAGLIFINPILALIVLTLLAVSTAARRPAPKWRDNAEIYAAIDAAHQRAVARERLPLYARVALLRRDEMAPEPATGEKPPLTPDEEAERDAEFLRQDAERWAEKQKVWARAIEAEDKLKQYAP